MICPSCSRPLITVSADTRHFLCPWCQEALWEWWAKTLDPTYDVTVMNDWERAGKVLQGYFGPLPMRDRKKGGMSQ